MIKKFEPLLDHISYKALRIVMLILLLAYVIWGTKQFQAAGRVQWTTTEQHLTFQTDGSAECWNRNIRVNRKKTPMTSVSHVSTPPLEFHYTDDHGNVLQVDRVKEDQHHRYTIHLAEALAPGECIALNGRVAFPGAAKQQGDVWQYVHYPGYGKNSKVALMLTLPEKAVLASVSPEPTHMFSQQDKLTLRFFWDDPSKQRQGIKLRYRLAEE